LVKQEIAMSIAGVSATSATAYVKQTQTNTQDVTRAETAATTQSAATQQAATPQPAEAHHHHHHHGGGEAAAQSTDITQSGTGAASAGVNTIA
jgi:hypothetical protein